MKKRIILLATFIAFTHFLYAQWQPTKGGTAGGVVKCFIKKGDRLYLGVTNSSYGLLELNSSDMTWKTVSLGSFNKSVYAFSLKGTNLFSGTDLGVAQNNSLSSVPNVKDTVISLTVSGENIFAGTKNGYLYLSTNDGNNWVLINNTFENKPINSLTSVGTNVFLGTITGAFFSNDNGNNFTAINNGLTNTVVNSLAINGTDILAATDGGMFLSHNNGNNWIAINNGLTNKRISSFAINGTKIYAGTGDGVYLSIDYGNNWTAINNSMENKKVSSVFIDGTKIYAGTESFGVFLSNDGGNSWSTLNGGLGFLSLGNLISNGKDLFGGIFGSGILKSSDKGDTWTPMNNGFNGGRNVNSLIISDTNIVTGTYGSGGPFFSSDSTNNWQVANNGNGLLYSIFSFASSGSNVYAGSTGFVYLSTDNGRNWIASNSYSNIPSNIYGWAISVAISGSNIFVGTERLGILMSTDNGLSWTPVNNGLANSLKVSTLAVIGTTILAGTNNGIFTSTDNGSNWIPANDGMGIQYIDRNTFITNNNNVFVATSPSGVFVSKNRGKNWTDISDGLQNKSVFSLAICGTDIYAGVYNAGVWKRPLSEVLVSVKEESQDDSNFILSPNPCSDVLNISCYKEATGKEYLIQNILGETVLKGSINDKLTTLSLKDMSAGLYFFHIIGSKKAIKFAKQ